MKKFLIVLLVLGVIIGGATGFVYSKINALHGPVYLDEPVTIKIEKGYSGGKIANVLYAAGLVRNANIFSNYIKQQEVDNKLKPGTYTFEGSVSLDDLCAILQTGNEQRETVMVTIPEGFTVKQIAERFEDKGFVDAKKFIEYTQTAVFSYEYLPPPGTEDRLDGFLFPETYGIDAEWTEKEIVNMMLAQFDKVFKKEYRERTTEMGMTILELITMASIVEKEAAKATDRPIIAGVFYNRLKIDMMLQSCATVQYVLGEPKNPLLYKDLEAPSPYNTYLHKGLPPGPIACPGLAAIEAALYPDENKYYYFLAKPNGYHVFNTTLAGHEADKRKYIGGN